MNNPSRKLLILLGLLGASFVVYGCGLSGGSPNEGLPSGTLISQGSLTSGSCGASVSGTVLLYEQNSGSYAANISGISYTGGSCGSLTVMALANNYYNCGSITIYSGTQNFYCSTPSAPTQIVFHCNSGSSAPQDDCAVANLIPST